MLHDVVESSRALLEEAGIAVDYAIAEHLPPVLGEETALRRVFQNLVSNAIKYGRTGRWLGIRARHAGREIHVTVADRGSGIQPAEQPRIFDNTNASRRNRRAESGICPMDTGKTDVLCRG